MPLRDRIVKFVARQIFEVRVFLMQLLPADRTEREAPDTWGSSPVKALLLKSTTDKLVCFEVLIQSETLPMRRLLDTMRFWTLFQERIVSGREPDKSLSEISKVVSEVRVPSALAGSDPENLFLDMSNTAKAFSSPNSVGILPTRSLFPTVRIYSAGKLPISLGKVPTSLLPYMLRMLNF